MLCGSNSDFRSRTFSASISVSNSRNFSLRYCFAARTTGVSLYLGIIITPDLIFLFYTVSEVYTISKEVSTKSLTFWGYISLQSLFSAGFLSIIAFIMSYFLICVKVFATLSDMLTVPTPKIDVCSLSFIGLCQYSGILSIP